MTPAEALLKAVTEVDAITAVGRGTWAKSHDGAECPSVRLPNRRTAVEWWDHLDNQQLTDEVQRYLRLTLGDGWAWWAMTKTGEAIPVTIGDDRTLQDSFGSVITICAVSIAWDSTKGTLTSRVLSIFEVHRIWLEQRKLRPNLRHPLAPLVAYWQRLAPDTASLASVTVTRAGAMVRRPQIVSTVRRTAWEPDVGVYSAVVDGEPVAAWRPDPVGMYPGSLRPLRNYRPRERRMLALQDGYGVPQDLRLVALQEVTADPDASRVLPNDVLTLMNYALLVDRPMVLSEYNGAALLAHRKDGGPRKVQPQYDFPRFWRASACLRVMMVWDSVSGHRWVPLAHVDVPEVQPADRVILGPPEWARRTGGKWTLTAEGSVAAAARVSAGRNGLAGRVITGLEYLLAAVWDGSHEDRRAPHLRPAQGKTGPGPVLEVPWRVSLRLAGDWWDEHNPKANRAALARFGRVVGRLRAGPPSYFVPGGSLHKTAPAGDSVEIITQVKGHRGRPAGLKVRASARFVEAARLAQLPDGKGFEYRRLADWAGLSLDGRR